MKCQLLFTFFFFSFWIESQGEENDNKSRDTSQEGKITQPRPLHANAEQSPATSREFHLLSPRQFGSIHEQRDLTGWHDY